MTVLYFCLQLACYSGNVLDMMEMFSIFSFRKCSTLVKSGRIKKKFLKNPKKTCEVSFCMLKTWNEVET